MKLGKKKNSADTSAPKDDFLAQEAKENAEQELEYTLDIPEDEIWSYQIEGLQAPHINKPFKNATRNKIIVVIVLLIAISTSIFMSVRAVHSDEYKYKELSDGTYQLVKYSNPGEDSTVTVDYVIDVKTGEKDLSKPITSIKEYAFNCDDFLQTIVIGKDVTDIDSKSIYSCWKLRAVIVDDENEKYCDDNGVLYSKDMTEAIHYPTAHDMQLMIDNGYAEEKIADDGMVQFISKVTDENGNLTDKDGRNLVERVWGTNKMYDEKWFQQYNKTCRTYVIPSTVTSLNDMSFAYSDIVDLYIPEGVKFIGNMALFKNTALTNIYTYKCDTPITDTTASAIDQMTEIYTSLPNGLEYIGNDAFYYTRGLTTMFIPSTVTHIGHHAFWDSVYKDDNKNLCGIVEYSTDFASEDELESKVETGDQWRAQYDYMAFKKSVPIAYSAKRADQTADNVHRQYYWSVQWIINNLPDEAKQGAGYLVKDMNDDGMPELVLRKYDTDKKETVDSVITIEYGFLADYKGDAEYTNDTFSELTDEAQLNTIYDLL